MGGPIPGSRVLIGVPEGWIDANEWYWDRYHWRRRPLRTTERPASSSSGTLPNPKNADVWEEDRWDGHHPYQFERSGRPGAVNPSNASWAELVGVCSGAALGLGVLILYLRPPYRLVVSLVAALSSLCGNGHVHHRDAPGGAVAVFGVLFALLAALMKRLVERPSPISHGSLR